MAKSCFTYGLVSLGSWFTILRCRRQSRNDTSNITKKKRKNKEKETSTKQQKETLLKLGLTKQEIKALKYEEARVKKIIELQEKNKK